MKLTTTTLWLDSLSSLFGASRRPSAPAADKRRQALPLTLEILEDRLTPSGKPTITLSSAILPAGPSVTISGTNFDSTAGNNTVTFTNGAIGTVTSVNAAGTQMTVGFQTTPNNSGALSANVTTTRGGPSGFTEVAGGFTPSLGTAVLVEGPTTPGDSDIVTTFDSSWTATAHAPWITVTSPTGSASGSGLATFTFAANTGATRTGTLTIDGLTLTVTQAGSTYVAANPLTTLVSPGTLNTPFALARDSSGNIYIADWKQDAIKEYVLATGKLITLVGSGLSGPNGVAVDGSGNVFIADTGNKAIKEYIPGTGVHTLVSSGLSAPTGVAVDGSGNIFISDAGDSTLKEYVPGTGLKTLVSSGLDNPDAVAVDGSGNVYIADTFNGAIKKYNTTTPPLTTLVTGLNNPEGVAVDSAGNVYFSDANTLSTINKVYEYVSGVVKLLVSSGLSFPRGVTVDGSGNVFIADSQNDALKEYNRSTTKVSTVAPVPNSPVGVAVDSSGNVLIADGLGRTIDKWNAATGSVSVVVTSGLGFPTGVAVDSSGNIYIADGSNAAIYEYNGSSLTTLVSGLFQPEGVAVDGSGNVYIADSGDLAIEEYIPSTQSLITLVSSGLSFPEGMAVDSAGNVYITDISAIDEYNPVTKGLSTLVSGLNFATGVAVDGSGNVYIADSGGPAIEEYNPVTKRLSTLASSGLSSPVGVAVDSSGNVYISDQNRNAIDELPRAFVSTAPINESGNAGSDQLLPVLPTTENLTGVFTPSSDQSWLTIGTISNGVINFSFTANPGSPRTAHITVLGQSISVNQATLVPSVISVSPPSGPTSGGTSVSITGSGFVPGAAVDFGSTPASSVTVNSLTSITAIAPPESAGTVNITVTTGGGTSALTPMDQFTFIAAPAVLSVSPTSGPTSGGTSVTITGTGFVTGGTVDFGTTPATSVTVNSPTSITAIAPPESAGTVDITVTTGGGTSSTLPADQFTFLAAPTVSGITPTSGPAGGGTSVTITGTGFVTGATVDFGTTPASSVTVNSPTSITAIAPLESPGTVNITVTTGGGASTTTQADQFTYTSGPAPGQVPDKIGTIRVEANNTLDWFLDSNGDGVWDAGDQEIQGFGKLGDTTFSGDWTGQAISEIGVARAINGSLSGTLDSSGVGNNTADIQFFNFGAAGDTILVGDWDGSGHDSIAVARPDGQGGFNGTFGLIHNGQFVPGVNFFGLGDGAGLPVPGSQIVVGDWSGSGRDGLAVARNNGQGGLEWLQYTTNPGAAGVALDTVFSAFGFPGDTALSGRWTGSASQVGVFRSPTTPAQWSLDKSGNGIYAAVDAAFFGDQGDSPIIGDWNASGTSKIGVYRTVGGALAFTLDSNGDGTADAGDLNSFFGAAGDHVVIGKWNPAL